MMSTERAHPLRVGLGSNAARGGLVLFTPISGHHQPGPVGPKGANIEVPDATLWRRQKQRNYSCVQSDKRNGRMDASAIGCEAKALQRCLPDEALAPGLRP
jgi:hypothetical protein